jgi:geranylgeranyl diphosphate synthase, type I
LLSALNDVKKYWRDLSRPALTSLSCEAVGGKLGEAEDVSLMLTLGSSGFGIHDDIIDRSLNKHLRMTIYGLYGIESALLVGDLLIMKAWTTIHEMVRKNHKPNAIADVIQAYGNASVEICEAELMETLCRRRLDTDLEYYKNILWKAMAEIEACTKIGAILGGGTKSEIQALAEFGRRFGYISRLGDDIEDCLNLKGDLVHRMAFESVPLPLLYAAKSSNETYFEIKHIIEKSQISPSDVRRLVGFCYKTDSFEYVRKIAELNKRDGAMKLNKLKPSAALNVLLAMLNSSYSRVAELCL